ncbi:hypothetical protein [Photobacterium nomapromontoriensis]|uniref:hypothetical protein n=1 Tax=Photobacterium nomapromontoriensis TaxID=2910237 RepID=UPI003D10C725
MKVKTIVAVLNLLSVVGCQSTIGENYTYVPKQLEQAVIDDLNSTFPQKSKAGTSTITLSFVEHEAYIEIYQALDDDLVFIGNSFKTNTYNLLCGLEQNDFFDLIRMHNLGVKYVFEDGRMIREIGPWNTDICKMPTKNISN